MAMGSPFTAGGSAAHGVTASRIFLLAFTSTCLGSTLGAGCALILAGLSAWLEGSLAGGLAGIVFSRMLRPSLGR